MGSRGLKEKVGGKIWGGGVRVEWGGGTMGVEREEREVVGGMTGGRVGGVEWGVE